MDNATRILIVEDNPNDYDLAQREIQKSLDACVFKRVETEQEYLGALESFQPDVILSDYNLPIFDGMKALELAQEHALLTPFIVWTGSISEEAAAECMKTGANNYILKENVTRLGPAVLHALEERQLLLQRKEAEEKLLRSESNYRTLAENSLQGIAIFQDYGIVYVNPAMCAIMGYTAEELLKMPEDQIIALTHPDDRAIVRERASKRKAGDPVSSFNDVRIIRKDGTVRWIQTFANSIEYDGKPAILSTSVDVTERKQAEGKYQAMVENSPVGIFQSSPQGRFINVNSAMARIYGYDSPGEMINSITDIASQIYPEPEERSVFTRLLETSGTVQGFELKNIRKDGSLFWTSTTARLVRDDSGNILYYEGFLEDITDRKLADERLAGSEKRFRALIENGMDSISLLAEDGTLLWENPSVNGPLGYQPDELISRNIFQLMHPEDIGWTRELFARLVAERGSVQCGTFRLKHHDGTWRWIEASATNMLDEPSIGAVVINYRDITERRIADEDLRESQSKYRNLVETSHDLIWAVDSDGIITFLNRAAKDIYGFEPEELVGHSFFEIMDPGHFHNGPELFRKSISSMKEQKGAETHVRHRDGRQIVLSANSIVIRDDNGNVLGVTGSSRDITESKYAEDKLRQSEERYRLLFETNPLPMWIFDEETLGFMKVNEAAIEHYGYSRDEFLSMTIKDIRPSEDVPRLVENVTNSAGRGQRIGLEGIWRHIKKDGSMIMVEIISHPLEFEGKKAQLILATDITRRYESELEIQQRNDDLALINSLNEVISQGLGLDAVVTLMRKEIKRIFAGEGVAIYLLNPDGKSLTMQQYMLRPETSTKLEQLIGRSVPAIEIPIREGGYFHEVLVSEQGRITSDPATIQKWMEEFIETAFLPRMARGPIRALIPSIFKLLNIKSTMLAPLVWEGRTIGLLDISGPRVFTEDDLRRIENICAQLTIAIHRHQMEELLTKERNLLRTLIDNVPDRIYVMDTEGRKTLSNTADWKASGGKTMQDVIGKTDFEIYPPELAEPFWKLDREVLDTGKPVINFEEPGLDHEGNRVSVLTTKIPLRNEEGKIIGLVGVGRDITERKRTEARINDLLVFNEKILNNSPVGILNYKLTGECTFANEKAALIIGTNVETLLTENFHTIESWKKSGLYVLVQKAIATKTVAMGDIHHISTFGKDVWIAAHCITFSLNEEDHVLLSISDITERKQAEDELRQKNEDLWLLNVVNNAVVRGQDLDPIINLLTRELKRIFSAVGSTIYMLSADKRSLKMEQYSFSPEMEHKVEKLIGFRIPKIEIPIKEGGHFYNALLTKQSAITSDPQKIQEWITEFTETKSLPPIARAAVRKLIPHIYKLLNIRSTMIVPLISQEDVIGFLGVSGANLFTPNDLKRIETIGEQLTSLIQRQQAIDKVHKSEKFLQGIQNSLSAHIAILDERGTIVQINEAWRDFGDQNGLRSSDYCIGTNYFVVCESASGRDAQVAKETAAAIRQVLSGERGEASVEYPCHSPTEKRWFTVHITCFDDGKQKWVILAHENITERKLVEDELRQSEIRYRSVVENQTEFIVRWKEDGTRTFVNDAYYRYFGITVEQAMNTAFMPLVVDEDRQAVEEKLSRLLSGSSGTETDIHRVIKPDGSIGWQEWTDQAIYDNNGQLVEFQSVGRDITERKRAEQELRFSEERFRQLATNIEEAFWITDVQANQEVYISPAAATIWGQSVEYLMQTPDAFINSVLEEDLPIIHASLEKQRKGEKTEMEYRVTRPDGSIRWVWDRAFPVFDENGRVIRLTGIAADITERKLAAADLQQSRSRYYDLFNSSPISLWEEDYSLVKNQIETLQQAGITDLNEYLSSHPEEVLKLASLVKVVDVNQASVELYHARSKNDLMQNLLDIVSAETLRHFQYEVMGLLSSEAGFQWEGKDQTLDGQSLVVMVNGSIISGYEHDWSKVIVSISDITERQLAEEALRESEERFGSAFEFAPIGIALVALNGQFTKVNQAFCGLMGYTEQEIVTKTFQQITHPDDIATDLNHLDQLMNGEVDSFQREKRYFHKSGIIVWALLSVSLVKDRRGKPQYFIAQVEDITQRKQSENEIHRHLTELEALYENGLTIGRLLEPTEIGNQIIQTFARHLSWHHVAIRLLNPETGTLELIAFNQPDLSDEARAEIETRFNRMVSNVGQGLSGLAMQTGASIRTGNVHTHPQYVDTHQGIMSGLYMPLKVGDRIIGCVSVESDLADAFTQQDERLLATLANQASIAFENARLYQAAQLEISERRRAQEALWQSETHYRQLADSITDILFELDQDLRYTHWNKASEMFSGIPAEDTIGRSMQDIFGSAESQLERESVYRGVLRDRQARSFETQVVAKGQKRYLEINAYPSAHGVSVVAKDITQRRLAEMLMQKRFELMEYAANHSLDEVMQRTIDEICELTESPIGFFNFIEEDQKTVHLSAWSSETLKIAGHIVPMGAHFPLDKAGPWTDAVHQRRPLIHNDPESIKETGALPEDHPQLIRDMMIPVIRNERLIGIIGTANKTQNYTQHDLESAERLADYAWDIIERKEMETELAEERNQLAQHVEERTADLSRANSNLARALRVKDEFLANMSHELRTPLNAILGLSESLGEQVAGPLNEKQQKYLSTINESGHHLLALINDILDLAKIEAGQISLDINKVDVNSVCQASLRMIKQLAQRKNQEVNFEIEPGIGLMWADERRLKQMIVNLLSNAVKFTPDSRVLGLEVRGDKEGNKISISVWDQGIGISNNDLQRLFKPFVQLDSGLAREAAGTGLGLALVSQMAKLHGGSVTVESQIGQGSRFTIMLPWEPALSGESNSRLRSTGKFRAIRPNEIRPTILLIEDTREVVMMLVDYLEMEGFNMVTAQDGIDGLTQAKIAHPDLILMDIQMPRMDGFETTKKLRIDPEFKETPIIALTALAMPDDRQRCLDAGMNEYLSKPVNLKALAKTIKAFLYEAEANQS